MKNRVSCKIVYAKCLLKITVNLMPTVARKKTGLLNQD